MAACRSGLFPRAKLRVQRELRHEKHAAACRAHRLGPKFTFGVLEAAAPSEPCPRATAHPPGYPPRGCRRAPSSPGRWKKRWRRPRPRTRAARAAPPRASRARESPEERVRQRALFISRKSVRDRRRARHTRGRRDARPRGRDGAADDVRRHRFRRRRGRRVLDVGHRGGCRGCVVRTGALPGGMARRRRDRRRRPRRRGPARPRVASDEREERRARPRPGGRAGDARWRAQPRRAPELPPATRVVQGRAVALERVREAAPAPV